MELRRWQRLRWAVRATLILGVIASVAANVLHARDNPISQAIAAWPPLALLLTVELISRVPVHRRGLAAARLVSTATIAGIAGWVSYWHMVGVASKYGESGASPYLLPLSVDGLIVVASICLVELSGRITTAQGIPSAAAAAHPAATSAELSPTVPAPRTPTPASTIAAPRPAADPAGPDTHPNPSPVSGSASVRATASSDPDTRPGTHGPDPDTDPDTDPGVGAPAPHRFRIPAGAGASARPPAAAAATGTTDRPSPGSGRTGPGRVRTPHPDTATTHPDTTGTGGAGGRRVQTPAARAASTAARMPTPATTALAASRGLARHGNTALAHKLDPEPDPDVLLSVRERVFLLLDQEADADDTRRPTTLADTLLDRLGDVDRDTVARYIRIWRTAVTEGRRNPGGRLRSVPPQRPDGSST